jgi:hypothetical protein
MLGDSAQEHSQRQGVSDVGIVLEEEVMSCFVSDWSCFMSISYGLPLGPSSFILCTSLTLVATLLSCVVSRDVSVMCGVALFCVVPRPSDTSIVVLGFVTHSTVREELQSCLRYVYILRT